MKRLRPSTVVRIVLLIMIVVPFLIYTYHPEYKTLTDGLDLAKCGNDPNKAMFFCERHTLDHSFITSEKDERIICAPALDDKADPCHKFWWKLP